MDGEENKPEGTEETPGEGSEAGTETPKEGEEGAAE